MKKKALIFLLCLVSCMGIVGCSAKESGASKEGKKPVIVVTTSFLADMVKNIAGDEVAVEALIPAGEDPHVYTAKVSDLQKISDADLLLYHGLHFEGKMVEALEAKGVAVTADFSTDHLIRFEEEGAEVVDPHFWFDLQLYQAAVKKVVKELQGILPQQAETFQQREQVYITELERLDEWIKEQLKAIPLQKRYLVTPHDAFNYFARAYQFQIYAPQGISTDSEVANKDMIEIVDFIVEKNIPAIFTESTTNPERMEKIKEAVAAQGKTIVVISGEGQELFSDSLAPKQQLGDTFIEMYKHNIRLIVTHLQ